ncbi:DUF500-domain-containing protein [Atractiella rhizophila]|nr:DUF500-domain-containing protein [Atractiella rhizophila]
MLGKFQSAVKKAQIEVTAFGKKVGEGLDDHGKQLGTSMSTNFSLETECSKAAQILRSFLADPSHPESALNAIPKAVLARAKGLAIFSVVYSAGFVWSGKIGSGVVIARLPDGTWSAPSTIATGGLGFGLQIGAQLSEFVVVLNSDDAVASFSQGGNVSLGGNLACAIGPIGTGGGVNAALVHPAPMFSYSKNKGLFAGLSLEGTVLIERKDTNQKFYGMQIPARELLSGKVPPPEAAASLYDLIEGALDIDESGLPDESYVPPVFDADRDSSVAK